MSSPSTLLYMTPMSSAPSLQYSCSLLTTIRTKCDFVDVSRYLTYVVSYKLKKSFAEDAGPRKFSSPIIQFGRRPNSIYSNIAKRQLELALSAPAPKTIPVIVPHDDDIIDDFDSTDFPPATKKRLSVAPSPSSSPVTESKSEKRTPTLPWRTEVITLDEEPPSPKRIKIEDGRKEKTPSPKRIPIEDRAVQRKDDRGDDRLLNVRRPLFGDNLFSGKTKEAVTSSPKRIKVEDGLFSIKSRDGKLSSPKRIPIEDGSKQANKPEEQTDSEPAILEKEPSSPGVVLEDNDKANDTGARPTEHELVEILDSQDSQLKPATKKPNVVCVFPPGPKSVTLLEEDLQCLEPNQFLNDSVIDLYMAYIQRKIAKTHGHRFYIFGTYFFNRLTEKEDNYARVRKWTRGDDIFSYDFILIPINQHLHWKLAMICYPGNVGRPDVGDRHPYIVLFDSLHSYEGSIFKQLRNYLNCEALDKNRTDLAGKFDENSMPGLLPDVPKQNNFSDCGVFVLQYTNVLMECPPAKLSQNKAEAKKEIEKCFESSMMPSSEYRQQVKNHILQLRSHNKPKLSLEYEDVEADIDII